MTALHVDWVVGLSSLSLMVSQEASHLWEHGAFITLITPLITTIFGQSECARWWMGFDHQPPPPTPWVRINGELFLSSHFIWPLLECRVVNMLWLLALDARFGCRNEWIQNPKRSLRIQSINLVDPIWCYHMSAPWRLALAINRRPLLIFLDALPTRTEVLLAKRSFDDFQREVGILPATG